MKKRIGANREVDSRIPAIDLIWGNSPDMKRLRDEIRVEASHRGHVIIIGETGTGKELVAKALHEEGFKANQHGDRFEAVSCATFVGDGNAAETALFGYVMGAYTGAGKGRDGLIAQAGDGVLFLDDIQDLPESVAAKLNRTMEDGTYRKFGSDEVKSARCRIIAASNAAGQLSDREDEKPVKGRIRETGRIRLSTGGLRRDFFERFDGKIWITALRNRRQDVIELFLFWYDQARAEKGLQPAENIPFGVAVNLLAYDWPGNVRELKKGVKKLVQMERERPEVLLRLDPISAELWCMSIDELVEVLCGSFGRDAYKLRCGPLSWLAVAKVGRSRLEDLMNSREYAVLQLHGNAQGKAYGMGWLSRLLEVQEELWRLMAKAGKIDRGMWGKMVAVGEQLWRTAAEGGYKVQLTKPLSGATKESENVAVQIAAIDHWNAVLDECGWRFDRLEQMYFEKMLEHCGRNTAEVGRRSGVSDQTWRRRLKKWGSEAADRGDTRA